jgi:acetylornithine deacetylase/succinyl-diaminopimelate desuccinylase-like protein
MATGQTASIDEVIDQDLDASLRELADFCRLATISSRGEMLEETAQHVAEMLQRRGFSVRVLPTEGAPVVYAEGGSGDRTLLLYNHYDVQPAEPLELWDSPPFEPSIRDGRMYARGVGDDKGEIVCRLAAIDALTARGDLPCRLKFIVEGEEEIGSVHLAAFVAAHTDLLSADACLWEGGGVDFKGRPTIMLGMRGLLYVELAVKTLTFDAHSGSANLFPNAAWRLLWALASLKDSEERC